MLDFTLPGYDLELRVRSGVCESLQRLCLLEFQPGGKDIPVTKANVNDYIHEVVDAIIGKGVALQAKAFREGFSKVFPVSNLQAFSAEELGVLFGNAEEDWSVESKSEMIFRKGEKC